MLCKLIVLTSALIVSANAGFLASSTVPVAYNSLPAYPYTLPVPATYSAFPYRAVPASVSSAIAPAVFPAAAPFRTALPAVPAAAAPISPFIKTAVPAAPLVKAASVIAPVAAATPIATSPVAAAPLAVAPIATAKVDYADAYPQYQYAYNIQDALTGDSKAQEEIREGGVVKGRYSLIDADGSRRTVSYYADPLNGFNAVVQKDLPVVAAAPVPPVGQIVKTVPSIVSV